MLELWQNYAGIMQKLIMLTNARVLIMLEIC